MCTNIASNVACANSMAIQIFELKMFARMMKWDWNTDKRSFDWNIWLIVSFQGDRRLTIFLICSTNWPIIPKEYNKSFACRIWYCLLAKFVKPWNTDNVSIFVLIANIWISCTLFNRKYRIYLKRKSEIFFKLSKLLYCQIWLQFIIRIMKITSIYVT